MKQKLLFLTILCASFIGYSQAVGDIFVEGFITYEITSLAPDEVEVHDYNHSGPTDVVIPNTITNSGTTFNVTSIGDEAFYYNGPTGKITSVTLPSNVVTISNGAFRVQNLTTLTIPSNVNSIGEYAFWSNDLTTVVFENGIESIGANAFNSNQLTDIIFPDSVTSIGQAAFLANQLISVTLSNSLTSIEGNIFQSNQIQSVIIPNSVTSIAGGAFGNNQISSLTLSNSLTYVGIGAFRNNNLTDVTIPSTVTNIEYSAFRDNPLATVASQAITPPTIFVPGINDSFWNRSVIDLTIPPGTSAAYAAGGWTGFNSVIEAAALNVGDTFVVDYITYEVTSVSPYTVEAIDYDMAGGTVVDIPTTVSNSVFVYAVTSIGPGAFSQNQLTSVTIPNSVTNIKNHAFNNNQFTSIVIPESVVSIGSLAFGVNNLNAIAVLGTTPPTIITGGGGDTFANSSRPNINLIIPNNTTDDYVTDSGALWTGFKMVFEGTSTSTAEVSNYDSANGTDLTIPSSLTVGSVVLDVTRIDDSAFENIGLTSVVIPDSVTEIGISAFNLNNLSSVTIPDSVTLIGTTAFGTNSIANLSLGTNVTDIGIGAFVDNDLSNVTIPSNVTFIGLLAFGNNPLTSVTSLATIPPTITTGTNDTFATDRSNIELILPQGTTASYTTDAGALWTGFNPVTELGGLSVGDIFVLDYITYQVTSLTSNTIMAIDYDVAGGTIVNIPADVNYNSTILDVTSIGFEAFMNKGLTQVIIPNTVVDISLKAFRDNQLTNVVIPNSVTNINVEAFRDNNLTSVTISENISVIPVRAFTGNQLTNVVIPNNVTSIQSSAFSGNLLQSVIIPNNVIDIGYNAFANNQLTSLTLGNSLTTIDNQAFLNNQLTNLVIPNSVTNFGERAFQSNQLTSVTISNNVTSIGEDSFRFNSLTNVVIPDGVTNIGPDSFAYNQITSVDIPDSVTSISNGAFNSNQLTSVTIPENVVAMGNSVFLSNPLVDVYSEALVPPTITTNSASALDTFAQYRGNIHLHIPAGTMDAYVTDAGALWTGFNPVTEDALSIDDYELANQVKVIAIADAINIISDNSLQLKDYIMYSISGVEIIKGKASNISTSTFASGIYILKLNFDKATITKKVVIN